MQLAERSPDLKNLIHEAISNNDGIVNKILQDQWKELILEPLSKLDVDSVRAPLILVIDALDECDRETDIQRVLQLLANSRVLRGVRFRVLITSRPATEIRHGFSQVPEGEHRDIILHDISQSIVDHDISVFLEHSLQIIAQKRALGPDWPGSQAVRLLVRNASGLFIWAATACRFISEGRRFAAKRLSLILQGGDSISAPEKQLNNIYNTVLENSVSREYEDEEKEDLYEILRRILGSIVILYSPLSAISLAKLLSIPTEDVNQTSEDLHAILDIPKEQSRPIRLHHPSFRDFLLNKERCSDQQLWVDEKKAHAALADACIRLMSDKLGRDICGLNLPGVLAEEVQGDRIDQRLPSELQYACQYWVQHLQRGKTQLLDDGQMHVFLRGHLLHWLEALSLMRKTSEGVLAIISLESLVAVSDSLSVLREI